MFIKKDKEIHAVETNLFFKRILYMKDFVFYVYRGLFFYYLI